MCGVQLEKNDLFLVRTRQAKLSKEQTAQLFSDANDLKAANSAGFVGELGSWPTAPSSLMSCAVRVDQAR